MAENVNDGTGKLVFYNVADHALKRDARPGDDESKITVTNKGNRKYGAGNVSGKLVKISTEKSDYGTNLKVELKDSEQTSVVNMKLTSSFTKTFLKRLGNVNLQEEVLISAFEGQMFEHPMHGKIYPTSISVKQKNEEDKWVTVKDAYEGNKKIVVMDLLKEVAPIIKEIELAKDTFVPTEDDPIADNPVAVEDSVEEEIVEGDLPF